MEKPVPAATCSAAQPTQMPFWGPQTRLAGSTGLHRCSDLPQGSPALSSCDLCGKDKGRTVLQSVCPSRPARPWVVGFLVERKVGRDPGGDRESCGVGGVLPELGHSVQPWAQADTVSSLPTVSEWDSLGFPTRWALFSLMSPPQSREGVDMPQSGRGVGRGGACLPHPAWGLLPIRGGGERVEARVPGETPQTGSLDTRSLSSDGSGGWKSKINVPTGLFPLRPLSLQVDGHYPLFS